MRPSDENNIILIRYYIRAVALWFILIIHRQPRKQYRTYKLNRLPWFVCKSNLLLSILNSLCSIVQYSYTPKITGSMFYQPYIATVYKWTKMKISIQYSRIIYISKFWFWLVFLVYLKVFNLHVLNKESACRVFPVKRQCSVSVRSWGKVARNEYYCVYIHNIIVICI